MAVGRVGYIDFGYRYMKPFNNPVFDGLNGLYAGVWISILTRRGKYLSRQPDSFQWAASACSDGPVRCRFGTNLPAPESTMLSAL
jgi:hypothetical protein